MGLSTDLESSNGAGCLEQGNPVNIDRLARTRLRLLDSTFEGIYQIDLEGRCVFMNLAACRMLGYEFGEALGKKIDELHFEGDWVSAIHENSRSNEWLVENWRGPVCHEDIFTNTDGRKFPVECCSHPFLEGDVRLGTVVTFRDISAQKRAQRRLKTQFAVAQVLESSESVESSIPRLLEALGENLDVCWTAFWQVSDEPEVLRFADSWSSSPDAFETFERVSRNARFKNGEGLPGSAWASAEVIWAPELLDGPRTEQASAVGFQSAFALPIRTTQGVYGVVEFFSTRRLPVDSDLAGVLGLIGASIGQVFERKRSESVRIRLAAILDAANDFAGLVLDSTGMVLSLSRAAKAIFGVPPQELVGRPLSDLIPDYRRVLYENGWPEDLGSADFQPFAMRMQGRNRSGEAIPLEVTLGTCVQNESRVMAGVIRDITELTLREEAFERQAEDLRNSEDALRHQTRLVNSIITSMADGVIAADENGDVFLFNPAATELVGDELISDVRGPESITSVGCELFLQDRQTPFPFEELPLVRAVRGEIVDSTELFVKVRKRPEGFWMTATARPILDRDGLLYGGLVVFRDITEQKESREALRRAKDEAEAANRAKSEFLSRMSHELRTPMNAILGFAQLLEDDGLTAEQRDAIARILKAARHLLGLINEVLDISRIEAGRLKMNIERVRAFDTIQAAVELVSPLAAKRNIDMSPLPVDAGWFIQADRQMLTQVLVNLLGNAVKYNRERGRVTVSVEEYSSGRLRIKIADTGLGMSAEQLKKLFVPFERLGAERSDVEGTGLGLAYSKRMVNAMGGNIGVDSEVGKGSVFWIELGSAEPEKAEAKTPPVRSQSVLESSAVLDMGLANVLCIQSDPAAFREVEELFERLPGYGVLSETEGRAGLRTALEQAPHLILLDTRLPDMNGLEVLKELRKQAATQHIPVVVLSADLTDDLKQRALDAGASSCLRKPIQVRDLLDTVACFI